MKPRLVYDAGCPVCMNYVRLLKKSVPETELEYFGTGGGGNDFKYIDRLGATHEGKKGIEAMANEFPAIANLMPMLPANYRVAGLKVAYTAGSVARRVINKVTGRGCNSCGR